MKPVCFASPTTFNPLRDSPCRGCPHFADCGKRSLAKVRAYAKQHRLGDLAEYLESELKRAAVLPSGRVGDSPAQLPEATVALTVEVPDRSVERMPRRELLEEEKQFLGRLPKKVADRMRPMFKRGTFRELREGLAAGKNPFPTSTMPYLHVGAEALIAGGRLSKAQLRAIFMERFGWTEGTAFSRVAIVARVLLEFGVATDDGHVLVFAPTSKP